MRTRMKPKRIALLISLMCAAGCSWAQDIHFSQFFEAPLLRNPSLAGIYTGDIRVQGVYRDQWNSVTNAYRTGSFNAEYKMPVGKGDDFMTVGLQALYDKAGTVGLATTHLLPALNYHKSLSNQKVMYLSLGFMGGMIRKSLDLAKITTDDQYGPGGFDPTLPNGEPLNTPNFTTWDASVGMSFNTTFGENQRNSMFLGAAYHHLNRPKNSFYKNPNVELQPKYVISAGVKFDVDDYTFFTIQADQSIQGSFNETIAGALYGYKLGDDPDNPEYVIHGGAFLRLKDALIPVIKLERHPLSIAISYDVNVSQLKTASQGRGGFELSLCWIGFLDRNNPDRDQVLCPKF
ncbi:PorP/SprF family type IX secretion system membrane protein [Pseudobacter ginsenosidimutans]|uniref:Type IX secretion system PorP/SprF family membrane protein n=1 Tax=Pseudobacter ginsenosidimutans TaxID=661488 RepID=A0A4Q7MQC2_9BACT|nr:PorP/SprF family type IX secretion system membrane protein [Pseudobacter ginsenosidimutans]QEC42241.1 type IX secretion system membrane protein PorP/SprF [Pseudobacter ginsenosidimutans]RZS70916.1 type IX secretion system PorP/SprF family membrane protein [Pseudobacter ginsenosidimutans]